MWIASKLGFFSIVHKEGSFHVRARTRDDLAQLKRAAKVRARIEEWPRADYRWRIRVQLADLARVFAALQSSIDYPNFKNQVAALPSQREKLGAYEHLWGRLAMLQHESAGFL